MRLCAVGPTPFFGSPSPLSAGGCGGSPRSRDADNRCWQFHLTRNWAYESGRWSDTQYHSINSWVNCSVWELTYRFCKNEGGGVTLSVLFIAMNSVRTYYGGLGQVAPSKVHKHRTPPSRANVTHERTEPLVPNLEKSDVVLGPQIEIKNECTSVHRKVYPPTKSKPRKQLIRPSLSEQLAAIGHGAEEITKSIHSRLGGGAPARPGVGRGSVPFLWKGSTSETYLVDTPHQFIFMTATASFSFTIRMKIQSLKCRCTTMTWQPLCWKDLGSLLIFRNNWYILN